MAVISYKYKFIYALCPRTASTATANYLIKNLDSEWIPQNDILTVGGNVEVGKKHSSFQELVAKQIVPKKIMRQFLTFITVRNPFDSLFSAWYKKKYTYTPLLSEPDSFIYKHPGFAEDMLFIKDRNFSEWVIANYKKLAEDEAQRHLYGKYMPYTKKILRFENLSQDFQELLEEFEIPFFGDIPVLNTTTGKPKSYRDYYTKEAREIIEKTYSLDLERFEYAY